MTLRGQTINYQTIKIQAWLTFNLLDAYIGPFWSNIFDRQMSIVKMLFNSWLASLVINI
jgi:hypothetical protein